MQDEAFIQKLRATFRVEADELLQAMSSHLLEMEKSPGAAPTALAMIESVYREAHTLKGAARAVDLMDVEAICQALEGVFAEWKRTPGASSVRSFDVLHQALDMIRTRIDDPKAKDDADAQRELAKQVRALTGLHSPATKTAPVAQAAPPVVDAAAIPRSTPLQPADADVSTTSDTVRISAAKLSAQLLQAEDMLVVKMLAREHGVQLRDLVGRFGEWDKQWGKVVADSRILGRAAGLASGGQTSSPVPAAALASIAHFLDWNTEYVRSLEGKVLALAAQADQDRHAIAKRVDDFLEDSKKLLMLPFSTLAGGFPKLVRDLCREQGKEADLVVRGGDIEVDKRILEEVKDALVHALRNSIDHGVEVPAERARAGKAERATITIALSQVNGNKVEIAVSDDGAGIDVARVKASAIRRGILSPGDADALPAAGALDLVFDSEVSTSSVVTAISGRGLGMAIVRAKAEKLGGRATIESEPRVGTTLRLLLPLAMSTFGGVFVRVADFTCIVPTLNVERVLRVRPEDIRTVENRETLSLDGVVISVARLAATLGLDDSAAAGNETAARPVVIVTFAGQRIAFIVDSVLREEEVLIKPFRKPLVRVRHFAGVTLEASGKAVPVLNVADLMKSARLQGAPPARIAAPASDAKPEVSSKKVLVTEDSITSRMLIKGILESAGYSVRVAVDGLDGFTLLREEHFDLLVSDIEMPRMNGLDLTRRVRADKRLADLPVVLITALETREQREAGIDVGANAYIVKSSFDQSNLLEVVRRLI